MYDLLKEISNLSKEYSLLKEIDSMALRCAGFDLQNRLKRYEKKNT